MVSQGKAALTGARRPPASLGVVYALRMSTRQGLLGPGSLKTALPGLELELRKTEEALLEIEKAHIERMSGESDIDDAGNWDEEVFQHRLRRLKGLVSLCLEAGGLTTAEATLTSEWKTLALSETKWISEVDALDSEPLSRLTTAIDGIRMLVSGGQSTVERVDETRLTEMLESTHVLVHRRNKSPTREQDIQEVMADYLWAAFLNDFVPHPSIPGFIKHFKADAGIRSLKTAIEFKFVSTADDLKKAVSGIIEDTAGYKGSDDWTKFYSVIYMTEPFEASARVRADLRRVGAIEWRSVLVNGGASKVNKEKRTERVRPP